MTDKNKVDEAIARARAAVKQHAAEVNGTQSNVSDAAYTSAVQKELRDRKKEQKKLEQVQRKLDQEKERERRRLEREEKKRLKALEREAERRNKEPAHMSKVKKAEERLPPLSGELSSTLSDMLEGFTVPELSLLTAHLRVQVRAQQTLASVDVGFDVGQQVRIIASENNPELIGRIGTVVEMRKIRVNLDVEGVDRYVYLFTADCEPINVAEVLEDQDGDEDGEPVPCDEVGVTALDSGDDHDGEEKEEVNVAEVPTVEDEDVDQEDDALDPTGTYDE